MPTQPYKDAAGKRIPSVTTVIGRFKESGALIAWAWNLGKEGIDYRQVRDDAADAGTLAHAMVEATIRGTPFPDEKTHDAEKWQKAISAFGAFEEWKRQTQLQPADTEVSMTCECHRVGGTLDTILVQGKLSLGDWKTSNGVYPEYMIQLAAYRHLWTVNYPDRPLTGGSHLLRFSKAGGDFTHHYWADLSEAWAAFEHMRPLYDIMAGLKGRV
jgi:hypothetical protein